MAAFPGGQGGNPPRPAPPQRPGPACVVSFSGRSAVPRRGRCGPALLRWAPKMQLPCRRLRRPRRVSRHGPAASYSAPMASRRWRLSVCPTTDAGMPPGSRDRLGRRDSSGFDQGLRMVPSRSASLPEVSRSRRTAAFGCKHGRPSGKQHPGDPPLPPERSVMANPCPMPVHLPGELRNALAFRKRHPGVGSHKRWHAVPAQDSNLPSGLPDLPESPPAGLHRAASKMAPR